LTPASPAPTDLEELLLALGNGAGAGPERSDAMAQFLSVSEGWRDAGAALRGAFAAAATDGADGSLTKPGLMPDQDR